MGRECSLERQNPRRAGAGVRQARELEHRTVGGSCTDMLTLHFHSPESECFPKSCDLGDLLPPQPSQGPGSTSHWDPQSRNLWGGAWRSAFLSQVILMCYRFGTHCLKNPYFPKPVFNYSQAGPKIYEDCRSHLLPPSLGPVPSFMAIPKTLEFCNSVLPFN